MNPAHPPSGAPDRPDGPDARAPWTEVGDRDELRRRLEVLAEGGALGQAQVEFVQFYFRASDPALYPPAAVALGRRLAENPELAAWLGEYARSRGIPLGGTVPLSRTRSARRVLLAAAAAVAHGSGGWSALGSGEDSGDPAAPLPEPPPLDHIQDLVAYLRALRLLLEGSEVREEHRRRAREVLERLAAHTEVLQDRSAALRWAELLAVAGSDEAVLPAGEAKRLGRGVLDDLLGRFRSADRTDLVPGLTLLRSMDGLIRGGRGTVPSSGLAQEELGLGDFPLRDVGQRKRFVAALGRLADGRRWWLQGANERAWDAFVLLAGAADAGAAGAVPSEKAAPAPAFSPKELHRILDAFELPRSPRSPARILRLLAEREERSPGEFVDALLLHSLEDEGVLVELIPRGPSGELGAILADALEHRIRTGLLTDPEFRVDELLARIESRRPHPQLFRLVREVVGDREFARRGGDRVPLGDWLDGLVHEAEALRDEGRVPGMPPVEGPLGGVRAEIRRGLLRMEEAEDPAEAARDLASLLEGGGARAESGRAPDLRSLLRASDPGGAGALDGELHRHAAGFRKEAAASVPDDLEGVSVARGAVEAMRFRLAALEREVAPRLPAAEGVLLERALRRMDQAEATWSDALSRVEAAWRRSREDAENEEARWETALSAVTRVELAVHRRRLHPVLWRTLLRHAGGAGPVSGSGASRKMERLMRWAVRAGDALQDEGDRDSWLGAVAEHWTAMMEQGMDEGLDTRVAGLLRDPGPGALALLPGVDGVLERTRVWLFDCYRLGDAARASRILNHRRGRGAVAAMPRDLLGFFGHYSPLWLALLVGAILMLDFGDAWTAMAEVGDVRGIVITFSLGVLGAFGYVTAELHSRVTDAPGDPVWTTRGRRVLRVLAFVGVSLVYTLGLVSLLWWLLSGTEEVVHGAGAVLHVVVWSGFALFIGVFFGLMAKDVA